MRFSGLLSVQHRAMLAPRAVKLKAARAATATAASSLAVPTPAADGDPATLPGSSTLSASANVNGHSTLSSDGHAGLAATESDTLFISPEHNAALGGVGQVEGGTSTSIVVDIDDQQPGDVEEVDGAVEVASNQTKEEQQKLELLRFTLEECLSDWGLSSQHRDILAKFQSSETGYIHISNLFALPTVNALTTNLSDITTALRHSASSRIQLDETGFQIKRCQPANVEYLLAQTSKGWAERSFYLENLPITKSKLNLDQLRDIIVELLDSPIDALRLPELYSPSEQASKDGTNPSVDRSRSDKTIGGLYVANNPTRQSKGKASPTEGSGSIDTSDFEPDETAAQRKKRIKSYALPQNGLGAECKAFAFAVVSDAKKAKQAYAKWTWEKRGEVMEGDPSEEESSTEDDDEDADSTAIHAHDSEPADLDDLPIDEGESDRHDNLSLQPDPGNRSSDGITGVGQAEDMKARAKKHGFRMMPITQFNALKSEYLAYYRDITQLRDSHEQSRSKSAYGQRRRSPSPKAESSSIKRNRDTSPERWEQKQREESPARWERRPLSPSSRPARTFDAEVSYPRGCVVFFKRFDPKVKDATLKALLRAILEYDEIDADKLLYIDHKRNVDSCHVRFADAATASFFASYFSARRKFTHSDIDSTDPSEAFTNVASDSRPIEAEVISGIPESIYWTMVPQKARAAYSIAPSSIDGVSETPVNEGQSAETTTSLEEANSENEEQVSSVKRSLSEVLGEGDPDTIPAKRVHIDGVNKSPLAESSVAV